MHCDDDLYGIKNIAAVCPCGKVTVVGYSSILIIQSHPYYSLINIVLLPE